MARTREQALEFMSLPLAARCLRQARDLLEGASPATVAVLEPALEFLEPAIERLTPVVLGWADGGLVSHHGTVAPPSATVLAVATPSRTIAGMSELDQMPELEPAVVAFLQMPRGVTTLLGILAEEDGEAGGERLLITLGQVCQALPELRAQIEKLRPVPAVVALIGGSRADGFCGGIFIVAGENIDPREFQ
jgi:hypothetical protein